MEPLQIFEAFVTLVGFVGVYFNLKKDARCFLVWIPCNFAWIFLDVNKGLWGQALTMVVMIFTGVYGYYDWKKNSPKRKDESDEACTGS